MIEVYNHEMQEFEKGDVIYAGRKFSEAELLFPQSVWAPRAVLMSAYGYFSQGYYANAINDLERFIVKYKNHKNRRRCVLRVDEIDRSDVAIGNLAKISKTLKNNSEA